MVVLSNFLAPQEGVRHEEPNTTAYLNDREVGKGTLYITESVLSWVNNTTQQGFSLQYPHISVHGISRSSESHPRHHLFVMVNIKIDLPGVEVVQQNEENSEDDDDDDDDDKSDTIITELRFAPDNIQSLDDMNKAMILGQQLNPDPNESFSDAEEEIFEDAAEDAEVYGDANQEVVVGEAQYTLPPEPIAHNQNGNGNGNDIEDMDVDGGMFEDAE